MLTFSNRWLLLGGLLVAGACKDNGPTEIGDPAEIIVVAGAPQSARANTTLTTPIQISVRDGNGRGVPSKTVTFTITAGGGTFNGQVTATAVTDANGVAVIPPWTLGKSAVAQTVRAQVNGVTKDDINVTVQTAYQVTVRFFGDPMSAAQQQLFTNAAARISAIVIGELIDADARGGTVNPSDCGVTGQPNLDEIIDDVLIYASISAIDGPGQVLAQAGPCFTRPSPSPGGPSHTAIGTMQFDSADLGNLTGAGSLQEVITHEMLHVLGVGTLWNFSRSFLTGEGTSDPRYTGPDGIAGCQSAGGSVACASSVPVENVGGSGTVDSHWREATFNTELMTGLLDAGANPFSVITIGSLEDLGFVVNMAAADTYTIFNNAFRAQSSLAAAPRVKWENVLGPIGVLENGRVHITRPR